MTDSKTGITEKIQSTHAAWFDEFIAAIRTHQVMLETNVATQDLKNTYNILMNGSENDLAFLGKVQSNMHFIKNMVLEYLKAIAEKMPVKLAFDLDDSEVLIWAEIESQNEDHEDFLLLAEAEINAKYHPFGYDLTSTIVECSDHLTVPNHYVVLKG